MTGVRGERGSAMVLAIALLAVIALIGLVALAQVQLLQRKHALQGAADLSAIAAAQSAGDACAQAQRIASANGAVVSACRLDGLDALVELQAEPPSILAVLADRFGLTLGPLQAQARAGAPDH